MRGRRRRGAHGAERPAGGRGAPGRRARHRLAPRRSGPHDRRRGRGLRGAGGGLAMFTGAMTALVTPFRDGEVDTRALEALVEAQIAGGINALVPCGSTGEAATLTHEEHLAVVRAVVRAARGRVPVIAGTGSNSTAGAIRLPRGAEAAGGHGVIAVGANLMPRAYAELTDALLAGDLERARMQNHRLLPLMMALTLEVNPIPVKTALAMMGQCADEFRLPLTPMSPGARVRLEDVLREYELV